MTLGIQDAKERGYDWVCQEFNRLLEDLDRDAGYFNVIRIAKEQMEQEEERAVMQELMIAEVDEMALPYDFDTDFVAPGLNTTIRNIIKDERKRLLDEFNVEFNRLQTEYDEKVTVAEEREQAAIRKVDELQAQTNEDERTMETLYNEAKGLREQITVLSADIAALRQENHELKQRNAEIEQNRKNAAQQLDEAQNEILRLEDQVDELRRVNALGERQAQRPIIELTKTTNDLYEQAKQAAAAKRQVMVTANIGLYREIQDAHGNKDVVHESALNEVEVVTEFPELLETPFEQEPIGTQYDVEESPVVFGGIEDSSAGDLVEEVREAAFAETVEVAQETAYSEEVGETFEQEVRRRLARIEDTLYPKVYDPETEAA